MHDFKRFVRERDSALRSLDKTKILNYSREYGVPVPSDETMFWGGVHKARLQLKGFTAEERKVSRQWLAEHGFQPGVFGVPPMESDGE